MKNEWYVFAGKSMTETVIFLHMVSDISAAISYIYLRKWGLVEPPLSILTFRLIQL